MYISLFLILIQVHLSSMSVFSNWPSSRTVTGYVFSLGFSNKSKFISIGNDRGRAQLYRYYYGSIQATLMYKHVHTCTHTICMLLCSENFYEWLKSAELQLIVLVLEALNLVLEALNLVLEPMTGYSISRN